MRALEAACLAVCLPACVLLLGGCPSDKTADNAEPLPTKEVSQAAPEPSRTVPPELPPMSQPVDFWENGKVARQVDAAVTTHGGLILDLGEAWTPYLFTDGVSADGKPLPNAYRSTYLQLARGEFPDNYHGERAKADKYLELYGIMPTISTLRDRIRATAKETCGPALDLTALLSFTGLVTYENNTVAQRNAADFSYLKNHVHGLLQSAHVEKPEQLDLASLTNKDRDVVQRYLQKTPEYFAVEALQARLQCEGYFKTRGNKFTRGAMDWATHDALAEFERRNRVFSMGYMGKESLVPLRMFPMQAEREGVLRVLVERAIHAAGVLEDGSASKLADGTQRTFKGVDGKDHPVPDLVSDLQDKLIAAFGLQTPESTLAWLDSLGELKPGEHRFVAIKAPVLPEYYGSDMQLTVDYDRGDVWYDFLYGDHGEELAQPVQRRPQATVSVFYNQQKIPIARYGTTIGGWRKEMVDETSMWKYKESPVGPRAWEEIVAAPVWLPPDGTPPTDLLKKNLKKRLATDPDYVLNRHEIGPSYASAYGLVAAYHRTYFKKADGTVLIGNDEGIRTHGSVDYMSIMRRHSHGCHRLHNHIALRLMSFVLAHRPHQRVGLDVINFKKAIAYKEQDYLIDLPTGGYVFKLDQPLFVNVEEGRIRGQVAQPIEIAIPQYNAQIGAYLMPDNTAVQVRGNQLVPVPLPSTLPDGRPFDPALLPPLVPKPVVIDPLAPPVPGAPLPGAAMSPRAQLAPGSPIRSAQPMAAGPAASAVPGSNMQYVGRGMPPQPAPRLVTGGAVATAAPIVRVTPAAAPPPNSAATLPARAAVVPSATAGSKPPIVIRPAAP